MVNEFQIRFDEAAQEQAQEEKRQAVLQARALEISESAAAFASEAGVPVEIITHRGMTIIRKGPTGLTIEVVEGDQYAVLRDRDLNGVLLDRRAMQDAVIRLIRR